MARVASRRSATKQSRPAAAEHRAAGSPHAVLVVMCVGYFLAALTFGCVDAGRDGIGPVSLAVFLAAAVALVAFFTVERRRGELQLALFRRPAFATANAVAGVMNLGTPGTLFVLKLTKGAKRKASKLIAAKLAAGGISRAQLAKLTGALPG